MTVKSRIAVCILAGGESRRFGGNKALAEWRGGTLIGHILDRVRAQTDGPVAINAAAPEAFAGLGVPVVSDEAWLQAGPLAGVRTAMLWADRAGHAEVVTLGVDLPFLPKDYIAAIAEPRAPAVAGSDGRLHPVNGIWPVAQLPELEAYLESGKRSAHGWSESCNAAIVEFAPTNAGIDPFFNVNTAEDLRIAMELADRDR